MQTPLKQLVQQRQLASQVVRRFFEERQFLEVEAPILVTAPGTEVYLDYFQTEWFDYQNQAHPLYLRSSPELHLKQALAQGLDRIYHLGKAFRNGGELSAWHHPEFTMLEWYQADISFEDFMAQSFALVEAMHESFRRNFPDQVRAHLPQAVSLSVYEAFSRFAKIDLCDQDAGLAAKARSLGYHSVRADDDFETSFFKILLDVIEPRLKEMDAVFLYDYPPSQAALATVRQQRAKRFELYLSGIEICNAFEELLDPAENLARIQSSNQKRAACGRPSIPLDLDFIGALEHGLPSCCGNALGFDRLLAYLLQQESIDQVIAFRRQQAFRDFLPMP
ncbi:MAG: EF-P lysine aminoacylase EpmA [Oligoflexus sp.]